MLYSFIISGYTDKLAYLSAIVTALWMFVARQNASLIPAYLATVSPLYGLAFSAFTAALLLCKYICLDGNALTVKLINSEKTRLEETVKKRDLTVAELTDKTIALADEISVLRKRLVTMKENSSAIQLSELRKKMRASEEDKKSALTVIAKNLQERLHGMKELHDAQLVFAADVLSREIELVKNEIKRGELSFYELCLKMTDISENLAELKEIHLASDLSQTSKQGNVADAWLNFIRVNDHSDPAAVERSFKFFKVAFHPDRFTSESLKFEATRYFQHGINAHNALKRREKTA